jgi:hypothetical protein
MSIEAMKQALEFIAGLGRNHWGNRRAVMDALRTAIEQAAEPVAWEAVYETIIHWDEGGGKRSRRELARRIVALYTAPPAAPRQWVGLTTQEILEIVDDHTEIRGSLPMLYRDQAVDLARDIEAKLKQKNA